MKKPSKLSPCNVNNTNMWSEVKKNPTGYSIFRHVVYSLFDLKCVPKRRDGKVINMSDFYLTSDHIFVLFTLSRESLEGFFIQKFPISENEVRQHNANTNLAQFVSFDGVQNFSTFSVGKQLPLLVKYSLVVRLLANESSVQKDPTFLSFMHDTFRLIFDSLAS